MRYNYFRDFENYDKRKSFSLFQVIIIVLISLFLFYLYQSGMFTITELNSKFEIKSQKTITHFETLDLSTMVGETIAIKGKTIMYPLFSTTNFHVDFYGLRDSNGFDIKFIPKGDRHIDLGETYTITGEVISDKPTFCFSCEPVYFLKETKI